MPSCVKARKRSYGSRPGRYDRSMAALMRADTAPADRSTLPGTIAEVTAAAGGVATAAAGGEPVATWASYHDSTMLMRPTRAGVVTRAVAEVTRASIIPF